MCGLAGAIGRIDERVREAVASINEAQAHRGPDDSGVWGSGESDCLGAVLAHRRLAIIDLSQDAAQPMVDETTGNVIVFNGEIYNYRSIRRDLECMGVSFVSRSDSEVLLKAYGMWGAECVHRLRGMFAFVIWDAQRREAFCARDRLGIKPLYYMEYRARSGQRVWLFASEVRALMACGLGTRTLCQKGLASYVWNGFVVGPNTIIEGVRLLDAGTTLTVDIEGRIKEEKRYWQYPGMPEEGGGPADLMEAMEEAVRLHLVSDVPLGVFLSGGIDSSAVTAMAARKADVGIRTFNLGFEEKRYDESAHARAVAEAVGTEHEEVRLTEAAYIDLLDDALNAIDQPTFDALNTYIVSRVVREAGITVVLAGVGGDELFGGYSSFRDIPRAARWGRRFAWAPEGLLRRLSRHAMRIKSGRIGGVAPQTRWGKLGDALGCRGDIQRLYQTSYGLFTEEFYGRLMRHADVGDVEAGLPGRYADELRMLSDDSDVLSTISNLELALFTGQRLLRDTDSASMAVSLEVRVPLLDHVVVERAAAIPSAERFFPLQRKELLRRLALHDLDPKLFDRPKAGFELPIDQWCRRQLGEHVGQTLTDRPLVESVGLDADAVGRLWQAFQAGAPGIYWTRIWALFSLLWWCRRYSVSV